VGQYLDSQRASAAVQTAVETSESYQIEDSDAGTTKSNGNRIRARTARRWLHKLGLEFSTVRKGVYVDGHERDDVVEYRSTKFIPKWKEFERRMVIFKEDGSWELPSGKS
jgi:hypothetical protein